MIDYNHLLGRSYVPGKTDCLGLVRDFFNPHIPVPIPNFARPNDFSTENCDLLGRHFYQAGFRVLDVHPSEWRFGDVALIALFSNVASHCVILVEDNQVLHHCLGQVSAIESYSGAYRNRTLGILRHKDFKVEIPEKVVDISEYLPNALLEKLRDE